MPEKVLSYSGFKKKLLRSRRPFKFTEAEKICFMLHRWQQVWEMLINSLKALLVFLWILIAVKWACLSSEILSVLFFTLFAYIRNWSNMNLNNRNIDFCVRILKSYKAFFLHVSTINLLCRKLIYNLSCTFNSLLLVRLCIYGKIQLFLFKVHFCSRSHSYKRYEAWEVQ